MQTSKNIAMTVQMELDEYYKGQPRVGVRANDWRLGLPELQGHSSCQIWIHSSLNPHMSVLSALD